MELLYFKDVVFTFESQKNNNKLPYHANKQFVDEIHGSG